MIDSFLTFSNVFSLLAIFISCLGLYGLVMFMAERRKKEISIRKVFGADITHILILFNKEFFIMILIAFIIAAPLSSKIGSMMLNEFQEKAPQSWEIFAFTFVLTLILATLTIAGQALGVARTNPARVLVED